MTRMRPASRLAAPAVLLGSALFATMTTATALATPTDPAASSATCRAAPLPDPLFVYGETMRFQVLRNGDPIGSHDVRFEQRDGELVVRSTMRVAVEVLFITAYRYTYESVDTWRNGCLVALDARIDDNGEVHTVTARADGDELRIQGPNGAVSAPLGTFPTNHWNSDVLGSTVVLNTITGGLNDVRIVERGRGDVPVNGGLRPALHFAYTGELQTEVWYDDEGRWVRMEFDNPDGSRITYVCEQCSREQTARR